MQYGQGLYKFTSDELISTYPWVDVFRRQALSEGVEVCDVAYNKDRGCVVPVGCNECPFCPSPSTYSLL